MEPFGLFQFLQSLLNSPQAPQSNTPPPNNEKSSDSTPSAPSAAPVSQPKNNETYLKFIAEHEKRMQKTRK